MAKFLSPLSYQISTMHDSGRLISFRITRQCRFIAALLTTAGTSLVLYTGKPFGDKNIAITNKRFSLKVAKETH